MNTEKRWKKQKEEQESKGGRKGEGRRENGREDGYLGLVTHMCNSSTLETEA